MMRELLEQLASVIADYRRGELPPPDADRVGRWVAQFKGDVQGPILSEMIHVLGQTYLSRNTCEQFIQGVVTSPKLAGNDPPAFWKGVQFLRIQQGGQSQADMLALFVAALNKTFGINRLPVGRSDTFVYLDDVSFSGNRIRNDLRQWIANTAPQSAKVHIVVMAYHRGGKFYADTELKKTAKAAGKEVEFTWWRGVEVEDRKSEMYTSDVLRPTIIPDDESVKAYIAGMRYAPVLRAAGGIGEHKFFSSDQQRQLLEQEFLAAGCRIRKMCPNLKVHHRPLGFMVLDTLGFGTMITTYRNCPNNMPLALWVGNPWIPLFTRKNN